MSTAHTWNFFRAGGFDQVQLDRGADLIALNELDQKLWVALSCPTRGIEFDTRTLDLIDVDGDGHVRANEVLAAVAWAGSLLKDPDLLIRGADSIALADIDDSDEEGKQVLASVRHILKSLHKPEATAISLADMADLEKVVAQMEFNGDGVICAKQVNDATLRLTVEDIIKCCGTVNDLSGEAGINQDISDKFFADVEAYAAWLAQAEGNAAILFAGEKTQAAAEAYHAVKDKIDDYFTRCQLAAYDARAALPLSRSTEDYQRLAAQSLSAQSAEVANFPLATVEADRPLPLVSGINPAWRDKVAALRAQLFNGKDSLSAAEWSELCGKFAAFEAWQSRKPATAVEQLGAVRLRDIRRSPARQQLDELIAKDKAVGADIKAIRSVERLLRYSAGLFELVNNFVSFRNFYTGKGKAIFQVGRLYLDGRSCDLCIRVEDVSKHAATAGMSNICLVYCECVRNSGAQKMNIAAAFTAGDADFLMAGRNGVFYDRKGYDWDACIVRIIDNPISIRQAFWSPYKKVIKLIGAQLQKFAASKAEAVESKVIKAVVDNTKAVVETPAAPPKPPFDVAKFAGIFAAIGLAIGAIGGILASIVGGILGLKFWQVPLAVIGLMLLVSCPSMLLAWFKLKSRNLGPILDANGWAINARLLVNIPFGTSLTAVAQLPRGAHRSPTDPYAEKKPVWPYYLLALIVMGALAVLWYVSMLGGRGG